ncbi:MAG: tRNA (adenosine(37)-N6)-threonylcarbamoyltransferase complex dimerization subunit type 1 TsaB [bacterium]
MLLAIEATDRGGSVALADGDDLLELEYEYSERTHSERLMPCIDRVLDRRSIDYSDLDTIAVCQGPGSFTAIRIGVTTAKTLAMACDARLAAFTVHRCIVEWARGCNNKVYVVVDARRGELYLQSFRYVSGECQAQSDLQLMEPGELLEECNGEGELLLMSRDREWATDELDWPENVTIYPDSLIRPLAVSLHELASRGLGYQNVDDVSPVYVRESDARS